MSEIEQKQAEIDYIEGQIAIVQKEIEAAGETLRAAKAKEATYQAQVSNLKFQVCPGTAFRN